jgi:hypothetical protein
VDETYALCAAGGANRLVYHDTPRQHSELNQIESWRLILMQKLLKRASCTAVEDCKAKELAGITYYRRTMARPCLWTYQSTRTLVPLLQSLGCHDTKDRERLHEWGEKRL